MKGKNIVAKRNSIRTKLISSLLCICIIPLITVGIITYFQAKSILNKKLQTTSKETLTQINYGINDYFKGMDDMAGMMAKSYDFLNVDEGENFTYAKDYLASVKESDKDILNTYYGTDSGKFYIYPETKMPDGYVPKSRDWYKLAVSKNGETVLTLPYKDAATNKIVITVAKAVIKDGKTVGVVGIDISLSTISDNLSQRKVGDTGYVSVTDSNGVVIAHPDKGLINTNISSKLSFWNDTKTKNEGFAPYKYNGSNMFATYQTNSYTGWKLIANLNESELSADTNSILKLIVIMVMIVSAAAVLLSVLISKGIVYNIKNLAEVFEKSSKGDLTTFIQTKSKDEFMKLGSDFNEMMAGLRDLIKNVGTSSSTVLETSTNLANMSEETAASIGEVAKAIQEIATGSSDQANSTQKSSQAMEELSERLNRIADDTKEVDSISKSAQELGSNGLLMVKTLIEKSSKTQLSSSEVANIVKEMDRSTEQINSISDTIAEITEQTNLLSLNASIEAARAGEAGRGFSVVADEIRKLADQSKISTEEIRNIIENIKLKSSTAVKAMEDTESVIKEQEAAVDKTEKIFNSIIESVTLLTNKVESINNSIINIEEKKQDLLENIENTSSISQEIASGTEEITASTEEINATTSEFTEYARQLEILAGQLKEEITKFKLE